MADRVTVTDPYTGAVLNVPSDSPQAKIWGKSEEKPKATEKKSSSKSSK